MALVGKNIAMNSACLLGRRKYIHWNRHEYVLLRTAQAKMLETHPSLTSLTLGNNIIGNLGAADLAVWICRNVSIFATNLFCALHFHKLSSWAMLDKRYTALQAHAKGLFSLCARRLLPLRKENWQIWTWGTMSWDQHYQNHSWVMCVCVCGVCVSWDQHYQNHLWVTHPPTECMQNYPSFLCSNLCVPAEYRHICIHIMVNWLPTMDAWQARLTNLKRLDISANRLESLPAGLGALTGLEELVVERNHNLAPKSLLENSATVRPFVLMCVCFVCVCLCVFGCVWLVVCLGVFVCVWNMCVWEREI